MSKKAPTHTCPTCLTFPHDDIKQRAGHIKAWKLKGATVVHSLGDEMFPRCACMSEKESRKPVNETTNPRRHVRFAGTQQIADRRFPQ